MATAAEEGVSVTPLFMSYVEDVNLIKEGYAGLVKLAEKNKKMEERQTLWKKVGKFKGKIDIPYLLKDHPFEYLTSKITSLFDTKELENTGPAVNMPKWITRIILKRLSSGVDSVVSKMSVPAAMLYLHNKEIHEKILETLDKLGIKATRSPTEPNKYCLNWEISIPYEEFQKIDDSDKTIGELFFQKSLNLAIQMINDKIYSQLKTGEEKGGLVEFDIPYWHNESSTFNTILFEHLKKCNPNITFKKEENMFNKFSMVWKINDDEPALKTGETMHESNKPIDWLEKDIQSENVIKSDS